MLAGTMGVRRAHVYEKMGYKNFIVTFHNYHQFEKVEWNKLVRTEMKARKYCAGSAHETTEQ